MTETIQFKPEKGNRYLILTDAGQNTVAPVEAVVHEVSPSGLYVRMSNGRNGYGWYVVAEYAATSRVVEQLPTEGGV